MKYDYGDAVVLRTPDDSGNMTERNCVVVSITPVETEPQAKHFDRPIGTVMYTVEFGDGSDAFVSETDLRPLD
jgi:hypothetical protein